MSNFKAFRRKHDGNGFLSHDKLKSYPEGAILMLQDKDLESMDPWLQKYFERLPELDAPEDSRAGKAIRVRRRVGG